MLLVATYGLVGCATNDKIGIVTAYGLKNSKGQGYLNDSLITKTWHTLYNDEDVILCKNIEQDLYIQKSKDSCTNRKNLYYLYLCTNGIAAYYSYNYSAYYIDPEGKHYNLQYFANINDVTQIVRSIEDNQQRSDMLEYESRLINYNKNKADAYLTYQKESKEYQIKYNIKFKEYKHNQVKMKNLEDVNYKRCLNGQIINSSTGMPYLAITCNAVAKAFLITDTLPRLDIKEVFKPEAYPEFKYSTEAPILPQNNITLSEDEFINNLNKISVFYRFTKAIKDNQCNNIFYK